MYILLKNLELNASLVSLKPQHFKYNPYINHDLDCTQKITTKKHISQNFIIQKEL